MVTLRSSAPGNLNTSEQMQGETVEKDGVNRGEISEYELCREERIRENRERMQKLGIFDLSQKLTAFKPPTKRPYRRKSPPLHSPQPLSSPGPVRRSSRLQSSTPVSYCELRVEINDKLSKGSIILREEGARPEVYTEEHEKLLGSTEMSWTFFVDGYGIDGKRIYDPIKGKTCHQCRQKTLGHRTHCTECNMVQGQFCGDCLYMRYGEHVLEAKANPNWICPVCRGICNCSLCRQAKGWPATGALYKKIASLGYKSVAHYLIQTRRAKTETENNDTSKFPVSAKRSLPFSDIEVTKEDDDLSNPSCEPLSNKESDDGKLAHESGAKPLLDQPDAALMKYGAEFPLKPEPENDSTGCGKEKKEANILAGSELDESSTVCATVIEPKTTKPLHDELTPEPLQIGDANETENENFVHVAAETSPKPTKKQVRCEPTLDGVAGRLRMRRNKANSSEELQVVIADHSTGITQVSPKPTKKRVLCEPAPDSVAGRLRMRRNKANASEGLQVVIANHSTGITQVSPKPTKKRVRCEPTPDSVAGRLRMRRNNANASEELQVESIACRLRKRA